VRFESRSTSEHVGRDVGCSCAGSSGAPDIGLRVQMVPFRQSVRGQMVRLSLCTSVIIPGSLGDSVSL
jgi:hypothetical protein